MNLLVVHVVTRHAGTIIVPNVTSIDAAIREVELRGHIVEGAYID